MSLQPSGRFGSALAVLDFNQDGVPDLAVGAPSVGSEQLTYKVRLMLGAGGGGRGEARAGGPAGQSLCRKRTAKCVGRSVCGEMISGTPVGVLDVTTGYQVPPSPCLAGLSVASIPPEITPPTPSDAGCWRETEVPADPEAPSSQQSGDLPGSSRSCTDPTPSLFLAQIRSWNVGSCLHVPRARQAQLLCHV